MTKKRQSGLISYSNIKLGNNMPSFALPTSCCDVKNSEAQGCLEYCYARRMEKLRKTCRAKWLKNFDATLKNNFVQKVIGELKKDTSSIVRWHVSGDVYSQEYLQKIFKIADKFKEKQFYIYTKAIDLDWSERPENLNVILSDDNLIWQTHHKDFDGIATIRFNKKDPIPSGFGLCGHQAAGMTCAECKRCFNKGVRVVFNKH